MRIAVLDDYQRVAHRFADWSRLGEHEHRLLVGAVVVLRERGAARLFGAARKAVGENCVGPGSLAVRERLKHHVVAALREWRPIP